jgi:rhodanese-related sulfurtransferase
MKKLLTMMGLAMAMFAQEPAKQGDVKKITDAEELQKFIQEQANVFFLDVREAKEIEELGSMKGYVNIPIGELEKRMKEVPKDKTIITA